MSTQRSTDDSRYPRPQWVRRLRELTKYWWVITIILFILCIVFFFSAIANVWIGISLLLLLLVFSISLVIFTRHWTKKDEKRERDLLTEQDEEKRQYEEGKRQRSKEREKYLPTLGFKLRWTLVGHSGSVRSVAWSPDGQMLVSSSDDGTIMLWNARTGQVVVSLNRYNPVWSLGWSPDGQKLAASSDDGGIEIWNISYKESTKLNQHSSINTISWSPDSQKLASGSRDGIIRIWDIQESKFQLLVGHNSGINSVEWSSDGKRLASGSDDYTIKIWNTKTGQELYTLSGHSKFVNSLVWSLDEQVLVSGSADSTIHIWNPSTGALIRVLEGHTDSILSLAFSFDNSLLVSKSEDGTVRFWSTNNWKTVSILNEISNPFIIHGSMFSPTAPVLATFAEEDTVIRIWNLDFNAILNSSPTIVSSSYTNAKVVLLGDGGVGKSGLGLVLSGQPYSVTESTHGRRVWTLGNKVVKLTDGSKETRETLLWDMAGQPGYRLIHQLYLNEVAVALVVFDAHNETDPFSGVEHWHRALLQAQKIQGNAAPPLKKFLVAARIDRGGIGASRERIEAVVRELGFDGYFATSAKEGWHVDELKAAITKAIDWEKMLPKVTSTELFQQIKSFLIEEKKRDRLISTVEDLYRTFVRAEGAPPETRELPAQFETCIGRVEAAGLIKRLSFGRLVLLQPEMLDSYASALVNVVKDEPDGLGHIAEARVRAGDFRIPTDERIQEKQQEELLLLAMVEDLLRRELALREQDYLVFPSQSTKENPDLPNPEGKTVVFDFEGPVLNIYATLAVRLANSGVFKKQSLWKNAIIYTANGGGECGMFLHNIGEGRAELTLFHPKLTSKSVRDIFEEYVHLHLRRRALPNNFKIRRITICNSCNTLITDETVQKRKERNFDWLNCPVCNTRISLIEQDEPLTKAPSSDVQKMDRTADTQRDIQANITSVEGKKEVQDFDVFLCYRGIDKPAVKDIGKQLQERGLLPWLDEWELRPGLPWQRVLEAHIKNVKSAAVFVGKDGIGPWQQVELEAFLRKFVRNGCPVIPVLLEDAPLEPELPTFLEGMTWVDFRNKQPDPMERLVWGITGKSPMRR